MTRPRSRSRWPRRLKPPPADMPTVLREFSEADWSEWPLEGDDPAQEGYAVPLEEFYALPHPVEVVDFRGTAVPTTTKLEMVGIGDRPEVVAIHRYDNAYKRWTEARRRWLREHVSEDAASEFWIDEFVNRRHARHEAYRRLNGDRPTSW